MSERADDDVRGETQQQQRSSSRVSSALATSRGQQQLKQQLQLQQHIQRGGGGGGGEGGGGAAPPPGSTSSTAMATVAERRSALPSPEIMLGQPWSNWVDAAKLHGNDGAADSEESLKDLGKNREAMRLYREDMPIFGQCPAQDDFFLVMCSHCSQVVKPQAFQAHYERRHSSAIKPPSASPFPLSARNRSSGLAAGPGLSTGSSGGVQAGGGGVQGRPPSTAGSTAATPSNSKLLKPAKEKLPGIQRRTHFPPPFRVLQQDGKILSPAVKVEKMHLKSDLSAKLAQAPSAPASASTAASSSSSSTPASSTTVSSNTTAPNSSTTSSSSSALKPGLNCPSIPKPPVLAPGQIPNGKGHLSSSVLSDKKQDSSASSRRHLYKRLSEREFNPDIHCGVVDMTARKPCTRSLTCKTHSLSQRRAVPGRRKRFDTLLAEHKNRAPRERDREIHHPHSQQPTTPALRDPHPSPRLSSSAHDPHQVAHGNGPAPDAATKPLPLGKPKPHNSGLPRLNSGHGGGGPPGDPSLVHESTHHPPTAPDGFSRPSSDEGENEEREEGADKLDYHYSGYHPRPAAYCTFGSRLFGRSCYSFDRRWDRMRCALTAMMDKHVNSQMWKKIPLALENSSSSSVAPAHRTSTNSHGSTPSSGFLGPPATPPPPQPPSYNNSQSYEGKSGLSYGTTLNTRGSPQGGAEQQQLAYGTAQARQVSSSPQMPSAHSASSSSSSAPSVAAASGRALKSRSTSSSSTTNKSSSFRPRESSSAPVTPNSTGGPNNNNTNNSSSTTSFSSGKKRKNSSLLSSSHGAAESSSSSNANYSSSFKKNCAAVSSSGSASSYHHGPLAAASSSSASSLSSSHSGVHSVGLNCGPTVRTNSLSLKAEASSVAGGAAGGGGGGGSSGPPPARGPPSASPAESIKRMSVVMNSSDSTLSLGPFVHHHQSLSDHHNAGGGFGHHASSDGRLEGKKRKSSPASSGIGSAGGGGGGGGGGPGGGGGGGTGPGPGRPKVTKSPAINNIHGKHGRSVPGTPGLPNNSHIHQPKARP